MATLAAITLIIGVYPNPFLNPITGYIQGMFAHTPAVLKLPTTGQNGTSSTSDGVVATQINKNIIPSSEISNNKVHGYSDVGIIKIASTSKGAPK
jgi:hypothetical protein